MTGTRCATGTQTGCPGSPPSKMTQTLPPTDGRTGILEGVGKTQALAQDATWLASEGTRTWTRDLRSGSCVLDANPGVDAEAFRHG